MLKGGILGIFCWICLFSECFLSIRDVVWLWAFACRMVVGFVCRMVVDLLVGWLWGLLIGWLWALLVLESFLEGFGNVGE